MPSSVAPDEERQLYLTPGGKYTEADIKANGNVTASQKFKGVVSKHDAKPKPGDRICPVSMTKANPDFTWIVNGKPYQFCCPPCVDEFVKGAKERPDELQDPDVFIKVEDNKK
jgi:YHS domain-containing protein